MQCSSMTSASVPASRLLSEFLPWLPFMVDINLQDERNVCISEGIFGQFSITARKKKKKKQETRGDSEATEFTGQTFFPIGDLFSDRTWINEN